ncbi:hypothetical protein FACS1894166_12970 [Bacilli bacterium]|nr:hypothetical protein FACS1894166_12970 [Bacilli bacterium]
MNLQEIAIEVKEVENAIEGIPVATGGGSCLISQSSGSTGEPKNILLTQDNLLYCCQPDHFIMNAQKNLFDYEGVERTFCFLPLKRAVLLHLEIV